MMWLEEAEELFKGYLPYYVLIFLPIFIIISPASPVNAAHEFPVYRMQHYDLHGVAHGCRSASISLEARSLTGWSTLRHCVIAKLQELTVDHFRNIRSKAGGLLIVLPEDFSELSEEDQQHLLILEEGMMAQEIMIPVYFARSSLELNKILEEISQNVAADDKTKSAVEALLGSIAANGYQVVINPKTPTVRNDAKIATIQGNLAGKAHELKTPTIAIVAYYDSFGVVPELAFGADSNGSGVAIMMELVRLFSVLYADPKTQGKYNIVFLLTGGGKFNYQGSKKWLEDQLDTLDASIIQEASYVLCLDTLASSDSLYMHVSKPPKENSPASFYFKNLKSASEKYPEMMVDGVHKKINLGDDILAWEHERYSIRRLPAFTLSSLKSHKDSKRGTILDTKENVDLKRIVRNTRVIANALASQIYNVTNGEIFSGSLDIDANALEFWLKYLSSQPRSAQLLSNKDNALVTYLKEYFIRYLRDIKITYSVPDKREPDFLFYDTTKGTMNIYSVKPAVFDLVLTLVIILYLSAMYFVIQKFPFLYSTVCNLTAKRQKVN